MHLRLVSILCLTVALAGCVTTSNLSPGSVAPPTQAESVVVLGVKKQFRVGLQKGVLAGAVWNQDTVSMLQSNTFPDRGYIVLKLAPQVAGSSYGVTHILPEGIGAFVPRYAPCRGHDVFTFEAAPGRVVYVGDIDFVPVGNRLAFDVSFDADAARRHLREVYPSLAPVVTNAEGQVHRMGADTCTEARPEIQIRIPARR